MGQAAEDSQEAFQEVSPTFLLKEKMGNLSGKYKNEINEKNDEPLLRNSQKIPAGIKNINFPVFIIFFSFEMQLSNSSTLDIVVLSIEHLSFL